MGADRQGSYVNAALGGVAQVAKAVAAGASAAVGAITVSAIDDGVTGGELLLVFLTVVVAVATTYATPNKAPSGARRTVVNRE